MIRTSISRSIPILSSLFLSSKSPSRQNVFSIFSRFVSISSPDDLQGLLDPEDPILIDNMRVAEEFSFLRDSLMKSDAESVPKFDAALIDGHCKAGEIEKACQIYARMMGDVAIPDVDMYFRLVDSNSKEPNVFTYGALIDGLCKAHKVKEAHDLLNAMSAEGAEPNHIVYDALIDGFCKVGKLDEAQMVFAKMSERGYCPNVYTYSSLIDRMLKDKRLDLALKVLSKMLENSCAPNVVIYTEMIDGLSKVGKTDEAYKLMLMMEEKGCYPNVVTFTAMIDGFGKVGKVDKCLELFRQMSSKGCAPNFITYRVLINHCCASGLLDEAHKLLEEMKQTYWPRHAAGYRKVIEGFSREFIVSLGLLDEISKNDSSPFFPVYRVLIDNFIKAGRLEMALEMHEEMASYSPVSSASRSTYILLIESLSLACGKKPFNCQMAYVIWSVKLPVTSAAQRDRSAVASRRDI